MTRSRPIFFWWALAATCVFPAVAEAGMPSINVSELGRLRLQSISFFLLGLLLSAAAVWKIWNSLRADWRFLPQLTYRKAILLVVIWGLMFVVVLTMISGARELMTPAAWELKPEGVTYRLARGDKTGDLKTAEKDAAVRQMVLRVDKLRRLVDHLQRFAAEHEGAFPAEMSAAALPDEAWELPTAGRSRYLYSPGLTIKDSQSILVREPAVFETSPLVAFANGEIRAATEAKDLQP